MLDYEKAKRTFRYEPETGKLFWAESRPVEDFVTKNGCAAWNGRNAGREITARHSQGYTHFSLKEAPGKKRWHLAHRVIWMLVHGDWPEHEIDHINGIRHDNRLINLRSVTHRENCINSSIPRHNRSGVVGISWRKEYKKWYAYININQKMMSLGFFTLKQDAIAARKAAEVQHGFHAGHGKPLMY